MLLADTPNEVDDGHDVLWHSVVRPGGVVKLGDLKWRLFSLRELQWQEWNTT